MEEPQNQGRSPTKRNILHLLERSAIPSFKHVLLHFGIAILLLVLVVLLYSFLDIHIAIPANAFVATTSSMAAASGALLAVSLALATFFSRYSTDWRDKLIDGLRRSRVELELQMARSAKHYPEISRRLVELYMRSAYYIPGQSIDTSKVYEVSKIFDDWAKTQALELQKAKRTFDFGDLSTYESFEKHLFDASLRSTGVRQSLLLLSAAEVAGRCVTVFPPLFVAWAVILLVSLVFAILGGVNILSEAYHFPILLMLLYPMIVALIALLIASRNIIMFTTRGLERGYEIAMDQLARKPDSDVESSKDNTENKS